MFTKFIAKENEMKYPSCDTLSDAVIDIISGNGEVDVVEVGKKHHALKYTYIVRNGTVVGKKSEDIAIRGRLVTSYFA